MLCTISRINLIVMPDQFKPREKKQSFTYGNLKHNEVLLLKRPEVIYIVLSLFHICCTFYFIFAIVQAYY